MLRFDQWELISRTELALRKGWIIQSLEMLGTRRKRFYHRFLCEKKRTINLSPSAEGLKNYSVKSLQGPSLDDIFWYFGLQIRNNLQRYFARRLSDFRLGMQLPNAEYFCLQRMARTDPARRKCFPSDAFVGGKMGSASCFACYSGW